MVERPKQWIVNKLIKDFDGILDYLEHRLQYVRPGTEGEIAQSRPDHDHFALVVRELVWRLQKEGMVPEGDDNDGE